MKLMILDGNSIINRAFYGVRLLSTKDGVYTNAIYGFLNILERLRRRAARRAVRRIRPQSADVPPSGLRRLQSHAPSDAGGAGNADAADERGLGRDEHPHLRM